MSTEPSLREGKYQGFNMSGFLTSPAQLTIPRFGLECVAVFTGIRTRIRREEGAWKYWRRSSDRSWVWQTEWLTLKAFYEAIIC